jgi:hypothetical protein
MKEEGGGRFPSGASVILPDGGVIPEQFVIPSFRCCLVYIESKEASSRGEFVED